MILLPEQLQNIPNLNELINLDGKLNGSSFLLFLKDLKGKYLHANSYKINLFGFQSESEILGLSDLDLPMTTEEALKLRNADKKIIKSGKPLSLFESATIADGSITSGVSLKSPLRLKTNKIIGVMGVTFLFERQNFSNNILSRRQLDVMRCIIKGKTQRETANILNLSPKTVEHYLDAIKNKLNCNSRSELISKAIDLKLCDNLF